MQPIQEKRQRTLSHAGFRASVLNRPKTTRQWGCSSTIKLNHFEVLLAQECTVQNYDRPHSAPQKSWNKIWHTGISYQVWTTPQIMQLSSLLFPPNLPNAHSSFIWHLVGTAMNSCNINMYIYIYVNIYIHVYLYTYSMLGLYWALETAGRFSGTKLQDLPLFKLSFATKPALKSSERWKNQKTPTRLAPWNPYIFGDLLGFHVKVHVN